MYKESVLLLLLLGVVASMGQVAQAVFFTDGVRGHPGFTAYCPYPADGAENVSTTTDLSWGAGFLAVAHDVYLGTDETAVANANTSSPQYKGNQTDTTYSPAGLVGDTIYYWRIEERRRDGTLTKGNVTSFRTTDVMTYRAAPRLMNSIADNNLEEVPVGPYVHFAKQGQVTIFWETYSAVPSIVEYGVKPNLTERADDFTPKTDHELTITGLRPETDYVYRIILHDTPIKRGTETYDFYSAFDYGSEATVMGPSPYPTDLLSPVYEEAAQHIIDAAGISSGYCIVYGCGEGRLAYELVKRSDLKTIGFDPTAVSVAAGRDALRQAGIYGVRASLLKGSLSRLNCRDYSANLIVSDRMIADGICSGSAAEIFRILRPSGSVAILGQPLGCPNPLERDDLEAWLNTAGLSYTITQDQNGLWALVERGPLSGAGEWTHFYADPANTACSGDSLITTSLKLLWYGKPGPRYIIDRHNHPMSSLSKDGLVVVPGIHRIMAFDAYNGARYWDVAIPGSARAAIMRDVGWVALADDYAYVAHKQNCVGLDLKTGRPTIHLSVPSSAADEPHHWGYLAVFDNEVIGSGQKEGASLIGHSLDHVYQAYYDDRPMATSDYIFCLDRYTGQHLWTYKRSGNSSVIVNSAIAIKGDDIYFIESRNPAAIRDEDGRVRATVLMDSSYEYLVKLSKNSGAVQWVVPVDLPFEHVAYLSCANDTILATGTRNLAGRVYYEMRAYYPSSGSLKWSNNFNSGFGTNGEHGEQDQHPVIIGNTIYLQPYDFDLQTGTQGSLNLWRNGRGCSSLSGCASYLYGRGGTPRLYHNLTGSSMSISLTNETRPGCFINMIPAGGLLLIPESSSGCTCDYPLQTSLVFMPDRGGQQGQE